MRFAELDLIRYGRFEDCNLQFRPGHPDLHIVFGRNEAGKSTTLAAVTDLLFGFEPRTPYGFRFDNKLLRVGATLERDGTRLQVRRRKSNKDSLIDAADQAIDEGPLLSWLHGQTRRTFELGSGLNHRQLRAGGQAILAAKDDVGEALFAAGSGLTSVHRVLAELEGEADAIWARRAAERRSYTRAEREHAAAVRLQKEAEVRPKTWLDARDELDRQDEQRRVLEARQHELRTEQRSLERIRRASAPARRRRDLLAELELQPAVALPIEVETAADAALLARSEAERARSMAAALLEDARSRLSELTVDATVLARSDEIEALLEARGAVQKGVEDLPRRTTELNLRERERTGLLRELGLADTADHALPSRLVVDRLRRLAGELSKNASALAALKETEVETLQERNRLRAELADVAAPEDLARVTAAVATARRLGDIDAVCAERAQRAEAAEARRTLALERLAPWTGAAADLARLVPPSDAEIDAAARILEEARTAGESESRTLVALAEQRAEIAVAREHLAAAQQAVSPDMVEAARRSRDEVWAGLRAQVLGQSRLADPAAEAARFELAVRAADEVADRRYLSAEASGQLAALDGRSALLALQADQARVRQADAATREAEAQARWAERLAASGLPNLTPTRTRAWLQLRTEALAEAAASEAAAVGARAIAVQRAAALGELREALGEPEGSDCALQPLLARGETRVAAGEAQSVAFRLLTDRARAADEAVATLSRRIAAVRRSGDEHGSAWREALEEAGLVLPWQAAEIHLGLVEQLRGAEEAITGLRHRIEAIGADQSRFDGRVAELASALGEPSGERSAAERVNDLRLRLARARSDAQTHAALMQEVERHAGAMRAAEIAMEAADAQLAPAMALAGAAETADLAAALAASRRLRALRDQIREQEREITAAGELQMLLDACEAEDDEALAARADRLETQLSQVGEQLNGAAERAGAARKALEALERGPGAAAAASDAQAARAEMEAQAEAYLRKRSQHLILRWAVDRYRERRQNPLLDRASALFRTLTLERYAGLRIDPDSGDRLLALCEDGATLLDVDAMSEGTVDQLYLALRLAAVEQAAASGVRLPFLADDLFINFDDERARAGFQVLGELARSTQVLFFTHHQHLLPVAAAALGADVVTVCELG